MDPYAQFVADRSRAFAEKDPMAALCVVANRSSATADKRRIDVRTLVLRELDGQLALFLNRTSPKWTSLTTHPFALTTYWPSVQIQYRLQVEAQELASDVVHESWHLRPEPPQRMDWFYEKAHPQSTPIGNRDRLLEQLANVDLPNPLTAPANASGLQLSPLEIERLDLTMDNGVHDRTVARLRNGKWEIVTLVP